MPPTTVVPPPRAGRTTPNPAGIRKAVPAPAQKADSLSGLGGGSSFEARANWLAAQNARTVSAKLKIPAPLRRETAPNAGTPPSVTEPVRRRSTLPAAPVGSSAGGGALQGQHFVNLAQLDNRRKQSPPASSAVGQKRPAPITSQAVNATPTTRSPARAPASTAMPRISGTPYEMLRSRELNNATKQNLLVGLFLARGFPTNDAISRLADGDEAIADIVRNAANTAVLRISDKWAQETE